MKPRRRSIERPALDHRGERGELLTINLHISDTNVSVRRLPKLIRFCVGVVRGVGVHQGSG